MELKPSTVEVPLNWFDSFVFNNGLKLLHKDFKNHALQQGGYFMPAIPYTGLNDESTYYIDKEVPEDLLMVGFNFSNYIGEVLTKQYALAVYNIDRKSESIDTIYKDGFYNDILNILNSFLEVSKKIFAGSESIIIQKTITDLKDYITNKLMSNKYESEDVNDNIFGFRKGTKSIALLYDGLVEVGFFSEDDDQFIEFRKLLTSFSSDSTIKLKVACTIERAAYIFQELRKLFHHLTPSTIERSQVFINTRGKIIVANDLSKALNKYKNKIDFKPDITEDIDSMISKLL